MKKRILAIIVLIIGLVLLGISFYIKNEVNKGKKELSEAQEKIEKGKKILSFTPIPKEVSKGLQGMVKGKINAAVELIKKYSFIAWVIQSVAIAFIIIGLALFFFGRSKK